MADQILRSILLQRPDDPDAAEALRGLYRLPGVRPPIDEDAVTAAQQALGPGFTRVETDRFVVLSDCARAWTTAKADLLERAYDQTQRMMKRLALEGVPPKQRLLAVLINDHGAYSAFSRTQDGVEASWVAGYYASRTNRVVFYNDATGPAFQKAARQLEQYRAVAVKAEKKAAAARRGRSPDAPELADRLGQQARKLKDTLQAEKGRLDQEAAAASVAKTTHEATHLIAFNCGLQSRSHQYPFWLTEGLATTFETSAPKQAFGPDRDNATREQEFAAAMVDGRLLPLAALVAMSSVPGDDADTARVMYAEAYALFRYLYRHHREALAAYFRDFSAEPAGMIGPRRHAEMFAARFGDPDALERKWLREEQRAIQDALGSSTAHE